MTGCFVAQVDLALSDKLKQDLIDQGFALSKPPYTIFSATKKGVSCSLYSSGKLTVQGKDKEDFIKFYLEPEILKDFSHSYKEEFVDTKARIGIDEAGKGDFFGPLCVAGLYAEGNKIKELIKIGVKDSKSLSDATVLKLAEKIRRECDHSIVKIAPKRYNELYLEFRNLNQLLAWGHATAIGELVEKTGCRFAIIDQFAAEHVVKNALARKKLEIELVQRHKGEEDTVVAGASILARAAFLEGLKQLSDSIGVLLPKGASAQVIRVGKELVKRKGVEILESVAKLHFKTRDDILRTDNV